MVADAKPPDVAGRRTLGGNEGERQPGISHGRPERWHVAGLWDSIVLSRQHAGARGRRGSSSNWSGWFPATSGRWVDSFCHDARLTHER